MEAYENVGDEVFDNSVVYFCPQCQKECHYGGYFTSKKDVCKEHNVTMRKTNLKTLEVVYYTQVVNDKNFTAHMEHLKNTNFEQYKNELSKIKPSFETWYYTELLPFINK